MSNYIPNPDADFMVWERNFLTYFAANYIPMGLSLTTLLELQDAQGNWEIGYTDHITAKAAAQGARQEKDAYRGAYVELIRAVVRQLQVSDAVTDGQRRDMGLPVHKTHASPTPAPTSRPVASVDTSQRLRHAVHFRDEASPDRRARPEGAVGCEVWRALGDIGAIPPMDPDHFECLGMEGRSPVESAFDAAQAGKQAWYILRWATQAGDKGPWSEAVAATVVA